MSSKYEIRSQTAQDANGDTGVFSVIIGTVEADNALEAIVLFSEQQEAWLRQSNATVHPPLNGEFFLMAVVNQTHPGDEPRVFKLYPIILTEFKIEVAENVTVDLSIQENPANNGLPAAARKALAADNAREQS